ncbi:hypothetical protein GGF32_000771 [Allomyces javanicus]|nr:hypothetical protein GGF32_000771 [Allomyces javanicus]
MGTAVQGNCGTLPIESARAMVVGRSLLQTAEVMGIDKDAARTAMRRLPAVADKGEEGRDVVYVELVRQRWEKAMCRQDDGTGWYVAA